MALPFLTMMSKRRELRRNDKLTRADFEAMQLLKFRKLVRHAQQKSPYYAQIIEERGIDTDKCAPADFPVLTKSILMANFDRIVTDPKITKQGVADFLTRSVDPNEFLFGDYHVLHTSGSSGEVGYFLYSEHDWVRGMAQSVRWRDSAPLPRRRRRGRFRIAYYAAIGGHVGGVSMMSGVQRGLGRLFVKLALFEVNSPLPQVIEGLNAFQPEMIVGYTTAMKILAQKQTAGALRIAPVMVTTGGEALTQADKAMLESAFNCQTYNTYNATEHLAMGAGDVGNETMTLFDDDLIYEFFDDHSLITNLFNFTQPLIRYRMSDILRPIAQSNPASPHLVINSLVGRTEKVPVFVNRNGAEDFINPLTIAAIFVAGIARFQMQLVNKTKFLFKVIVDASLNGAQRADAIAATERRLREILEQKLMDNVVFEVVPTDELPVNLRTRKFQLIVDAQGGAT